ncbi:hypothetical protein V1509DRAFT_78027 [Lipomyces kononenkoae]
MPRSSTAPLAYTVNKALPEFGVASVGAIHKADEGVDGVFVGRPFSHNPNFVLDLAKEYGINVQWPVQIGYTTAHM